MKTTSKNSLKALSRPEQSGTEQPPAVETASAQTQQRPPLPQISFKRRHQNRALPLESVLNLIRDEAPRFWNLTEVVGKWVWIAFTEKQPREVTAALAELGFHWNTSRQAWQHPCGTLTPRSPRDPRAKYGSYFPASAQVA